MPHGASASPCVPRRHRGTMSRCRCRRRDPRVAAQSWSENAALMCAAQRVCGVSRLFRHYAVRHASGDTRRGAMMCNGTFRRRRGREKSRRAQQRVYATHRMPVGYTQQIGRHARRVPSVRAVEG